MIRNAIPAALARQLIKKKLTVSVCESCTGGMLSSMITERPGSSQYYIGGIVAYADCVKEKIAGVKRSTLKAHGAVSAPVAAEMAACVRTKLKTDIGIGITGIAGPSGGSRRKPVGLIYIAVVRGHQSLVQQFRFRGSRSTVRRRACEQALVLVDRLIRQ
jgi:PncC family amidohydrolase